MKQTNEAFEDLIHLLQDRRHGPNRVALVSTLAQSADPRALTALAAAGTDPELAREVKRVLKRTGRKAQGVAEKAKSKVAHIPSEASTNLDSSQVRPLLKRVAGLVSRFGPREISQVTQLLDALDVGEERALDFDVIHNGRPVPMRIVVFMDDVDTPDVSFLTTPELAAQLDELMQELSDEQRI